jgi:hypothetical protein
MVIGTPAGSDFIWIPTNPSSAQGLRFRNSSGDTTDYDGFPDDAQWHHWVVVADGAGNIDVYRDNTSLEQLT